MHRLVVFLAAPTLCVAPAFGFDSDTQAVLDRTKAGKTMHIDDVATLMLSSERWCYFENDGTCQWSDIYLRRTDDGIMFEIGNAWDARYNIAFVDQGIFKDDRYICETGNDWIASVRAIWRDDETLVMGRELQALKTEMYGVVDLEQKDCFDYSLQSIDQDNETVTLLQRQFIDDVHTPENDAPVTLHFNAASARALEWSWNY